MKQKLLLNGFTSTRRKPPLNITEADVVIFNLATNTIKFPDVFLYTLRKAYVSPFGMVFNNGFTVNETIYAAHKSIRNIFSFYKKMVYGRIKKTDGNCVVINNSWYQNYYHWCTEALPRLFVIKDHVSNINLILPYDLSKFHLQTLDFFNIDSITYCDEHELVAAPLLHFTSYTSPGFGCHNPKLIRDMSAFFKRKTNASGHVSHSRNIYTSRSKSLKRKCINEDKLLHLLKKFDFEIVVPDNLSVIEQINLFSNAKNVLGVHGSSFVNCLFMNKDSVVFDLIENNHNDLCFFNLACALDVNYVYIRSNGVGPKQYYRDNDIIADIPNVKKLLDKFLCR